MCELTFLQGEQVWQNGASVGETAIKHCSWEPAWMSTQQAEHTRIGTGRRGFARGLRNVSCLYKNVSGDAARHA